MASEYDLRLRPPSPIFVVGTSVSSEVENEWNSWYDNVHLPEVMTSAAAPVTADRYRLQYGPGVASYLAVYSFETKRDIDVFLHDERLKQMAADYDRMWGGHSDFTWGAYAPQFGLLRDSKGRRR